MVYKKILPEYFTADNALHVMGGGREDYFDSSIDLLVWNIYKGRRKIWHEDFINLLKGKNLVLLQESIANTQYDTTFETPKSFEWVMARTHKLRKSQADTGVKTGSAIPSMSQVFLLSPDVEPILKTPKMLLATTYPVKDSQTKLLVVNIHAINFVSYRKYARQLQQMISTIEHHDGPIILAGDFNTWNKVRYKNLIDAAKNMGLTQVEFERKGRWQHFNQHLDHVFYRGLKLQSAEVVHAIRSSDHYPLAARFTL